ncbi:MULTISPECIES: hypothetical protein [unclassified Bradyrhizobium]|nr:MULTISPECIES: hypothetical protein [unclassified Bradyrhizobium]
MQKAGESPAFGLSTCGAYFIGTMHIIMPPQFIIIGMPAFIMVVMFWQHCMNASFMAGSIAVISQDMPLAVMVQVTLHIIIGMAMPGIPPIIGMPIIGIMPFIIIGDMPPIIGIMVCIAGFIGRLHALGRMCFVRRNGE